MISQVSNKK